MAKAKKSAKEASNVFHNIMKASVMDKTQILKIEEYLKADDEEMNSLASIWSSTQLTPQERKDMVNRLNQIKEGGFGILKGKIIKK